MTSLVGFLEEIEKLAYKLLLWVILIPKTIATIIIHPRWSVSFSPEFENESSVAEKDALKSLAD